MDGSLAWAIERAARVAAQTPAIIDRGAGVTLTYEELYDRVARLGGGLHDLGVEPGAVVGVLALNSHQHLEAWLGVPRIGAVLNDLNIRLAPPELQFIIDDCKTRVLIVDDFHLETGLALLEACPSLEHLVHTGTTAAPHGVVRYDDLLCASARSAAEVGDDDLAGIFYTGGTTGRPKGVMLTHANLIANAKHVLIALGHRPEDRYLHAAPMFHLADASQTYAVTWIGATHVIIPAFEPEATLAAIEEEAVTFALLVPTMVNMVVNHPGVGQRDLSSLRGILYGASPMPIEVLRHAMDLFPCDWMQGYGMTEAAPLVSVLPASDHRRGATGEEPYATRLRSAGTAAVGVQAEARGPDGAVLADGEVGEIWVRGPNVMTGYWNRAEETAAALPGDGWYRTGDAGYIDSDGYIFLVDRVKDMIVSGGENVYSTEVENALYEHPAVLEAAVIGVPDERWGERVHAVVVTRPGASASEAELIEHCKARIAGYKAPRSVEFRTDALPKSGAGKILKRDLREPHWENQDRRVN